MRHIATLLIAAAALFTAGCSSLLSLEESGEPVAPNPALAGVWMAQDDDDPLLVRLGQKDTLDIRYGALHLVGRAFRAAGAEYLDIAPHGEEPFQIPAHAVVRYWVEGDTLRWAYLDSKWFQARIAEQGFAAAKVRGALIATAPGGLSQALAAHGMDPRAHGEITEMRRLH